MLFDQGTFNEIGASVLPRKINTDWGKIDGDGVITGYGTIDGRLIYIYAQDSGVLSGSIGMKHAEKICNIIKMAVQSGSPLVSILDTSGARVDEGAEILNAYGMIYNAHQEATGHIPQISAVLGSCVGGAALLPPMHDFVFAVRNLTEMHLSLPLDIARCSGEQVDPQMLGSADIHQQTTGLAHYVDVTEEDCLARVRYLLSFLPPNNLDEANHIYDLENYSKEMNLALAMEENLQDGRGLINTIFGEEDFCEYNENFGKGIITGFARVVGETIGVIVNQKYEDGIYITSSSAQKAKMFINFCDAFNIPLVTLVNTDGFKHSSEEEYAGITKNVADMVFAYSKAQVPKITIYTGEAYGTPFVVMGSKSIGADISFAWENARLGHLNPEAVAYFKKDSGQKWEERVEEAYDMYGSPKGVAAVGLVDAIIAPEETLIAVINGLNILKGKRSVKTKVRGN
ncbi:acetyl-CoA carboxylase carboxyltransferase component [Desulfitispora alkaliphila]